MAPHRTSRRFRQATSLAESFYWGVVAAFNKIDCVFAILLVVVALSRVGDLSVVRGLKIPTPVSVAVFVHVISHRSNLPEPFGSCSMSCGPLPRNMRSRPARERNLKNGLACYCVAGGGRGNIGINKPDPSGTFIAILRDTEFDWAFRAETPQTSRPNPFQYHSFCAKTDFCQSRLHKTLQLPKRPTKSIRPMSTDDPPARQPAPGSFPLVIRASGNSCNT